MNTLGRFGIVLVLLATSSVARPILAAPLSVKSEISSVGGAVKETTFGDLIADALRTTEHTDIAFVPASAFREVTIPSGETDSSQLTSVLIVTDSPSDSVVVLKLTGAQIVSALERSASRLPANFGGYLQLSGLNVVYNPTKDEGSRVVSVSLVGGSEIAAASTYSVAMTRSLADGGMGYFVIWGSNDGAKVMDGSFTSIISAYALAHQPLDIQADGRLKSL